jgi:tetratricopeptide (TPR) repeat protein
LAGRVIWFYLAKLLWPANLMFVYPRWQVSAGLGWSYLFPLGVLVLLAALWAIRRRSRGPLAGALFFVGSLFPALGFFNVYPFVFSYVADHFQYLASLGIVGLVAGGWESWEKAESGKRKAETSYQGPPGDLPVFRLSLSAFRFPQVAALAVICGLGVLTFRQCATYRDSESLYRATLQRNPDAWLAHDNLGVVLAREGRLTEAIAHYREALRLNPNFPETYNNYGNAMAHLGQWSEATAAYARALALRPQFVEAEFDWGNALSDEGIFSEAVSHYENALRLRPDYPDAQYRLANALGNSGELLEAIGHYQAALRLRPAYAEAHANLGLALNSAGHLPEALVELQTAVRLAPNYPEAHAYLGLALAGAGQLREAVGEYRRALQLRPGDADVHYQLGVALRALGETEQAEAEFEAAEHPPGAGEGQSHE